MVWKCDEAVVLGGKERFPLVRGVSPARWTRAATLRGRCGGLLAAFAEQAGKAEGVCDVLVPNLIELLVQTAIRKVDGELSGSHVCGERDQSEEEDEGREPDEEIRDDELVTQSPQETMADNPHCKRPKRAR